MRISTKGRYALRLMTDVAIYGEKGNVSLKDVAERQNISMKYLEQIAGTLSKAGMLRSSRGAQGGYQLTRAPEEYRVGDILRLTEGDLAPVSCLECGAEPCERADSCRTLSMWSDFYQMIHNYFDGITLADLMKDPKAEILGLDPEGEKE